ncbi:autotransporter outer membrane beta-barrel domain-containing protein [Yersinia pseudotuberculosis]|uniref:Outer membrane autotransporter barrel domain protein n=12 Tax=Yersinia pseudotuberculosis complex TaxID=1649845 RepID=A0A0H3AY50_YERPY|nr:autotransporter outer membrane beta-barrel domain-containing protein [Yersinia pseudotuberculosis]AJJ59878.1 outer membrane autotransporter barrel domain protein [Yersinia pseudotuberculosis YPIII]AYW86821.1 autotransporter outer membrane beta-barrel domain-containing protein [Yersinia pseudotuberculosis]AYX01460.1 autotransporter outer membrane beta-barrel domain-containing protein [Yersinia pseudotuberculosis]AZA29216.1 autotransporter outer membrane beta-barrel domain-containing protein [
MNTIFKVIWNASLNVWVVVSELAKGRIKTKSSRNLISEGVLPKFEQSMVSKLFRKNLLALSLGSIVFLSTGPVFAADITVSTQAELSAALSNGTYDKIILGADITLIGSLTVNMTSNQVVIDGQGKFGLTVNNTTNYGLVVSSGSGTLTLQNMSKIDSANYYSMVVLNGANTAVNVIYNNIDFLGSSQLIYMGAYGAATNSIMTFGDILNDVVVNDRAQEIGEVNKLAFTGRFHVTHTGSSVTSFVSTGGANNTSTMDFASGADVKIDRTGSTGDLTSTGVNAFAYTFADGASFELIANQNVFSGTTTNRGLEIGSYNSIDGFGSGVKIVLQSRSDGSIISGNGIDNATTNAAGINNNASGDANVIYNLGTGSILKATNTGILATKNANNASDIYIRSAGGITAATGISATHNGTGTVKIKNDGTITSTTAGIAISSASIKEISVDNTDGTITATAGTGVNVLASAILNLFGGTINTSATANGITFAGTEGGHTLTDLTINLLGTGIALSNVAGVNLTLSNVTLNTLNGTALNSLTGLTLVDSLNGRNTINIEGAGIGIAATNTELNTFDAEALDINVNGAGIGIQATGGGVNLSASNLIINVANTLGTALQITDGIDNTTTIGNEIQLNAENATAINFLGSSSKTLNNNGTIKGSVIFAGVADHIINNNGTLDGTLTTGAGNDTLVLDSSSQSNDVINLGDGNNSVTIQNGATVSSIITGNGNDTFTINGMSVGSTYLGSLDAGTGLNTLNFNASTDELAAATSLQGFTNINLVDSHITLVSDDNIGSGMVNIDSSSELLFGSTFDGILHATLGAGTGSAIVNNSANVSLEQASMFAGTWQVNQGGALTASNSNQLGSAKIGLDGTLNLDNIALFNHVLTGNGTLNVAKNLATTAFDFGSTVGGAFSGIVNLTKTTFALSADNAAALASATLKLSDDSVTTVGTTDRTLHGLDLSGGTLIFDGAVPQSQTSGVVTVTDLALNSGTVNITGSGSWDNTDPLATNVSILEQDRAGSTLELINATNVTGDVDALDLLVNGTAITSGTQGVQSAIQQGGSTVANAIHNYGLTSSNSNGDSGLYVNYTLSALELLADGADALLLATESGLTANRVLNAELFGVGGLVVDAQNGALTLANGNNSYEGTTTVNFGELILGANGAFGQTSLLDIASGASANINGYRQTVGAVTNTGTVTLGSGGVLTSGLLTNGGVLDLTGGALNLTAGGTSTVAGGLTGAGTLNINGGNLAVSAANSGLSGQTHIADVASVTMTGTGTLGTSAVEVLGTLNLNGANAAMTNVLSGDGTINTNAAVTLSGNNSFSGAHQIGASGALTVGQASNLGASSATVNLGTLTSHLILNGVSESIANVLSGVAGSTVDIIGGADTALTANNSGFLGQYALAGNSKLTVGSTNNLGASSSVTLAGADDTLSLSGFNGTFGNSVTGSGVLQVTDDAEVTLTSSNGVGNTVKVDIADATLNLDDIALFDHVLTGNGTLNVAKSLATTAFDFGSTVGGAFSGIVNLTNTTFALSADNAAALASATLKLSDDSVTTVGTTDRTLHGLDLTGGTLIFDGSPPQSQANGVVTVTDLALNSGTVSITGVGNWENESPVTSPNVSILEQDRAGTTLELINATNVTGDVDALGLMINGTAITADSQGVESAIQQGGSTVANAIHNYGLTSSNSNGDSGLYVNYTLSALELLADGADALLLATESGLTANRVLNAELFGVGGLVVDAQNGALTLANGNNSYEGTTTVNFGELILGANGAFGQTSLLDIASGASANINGYRQTVGAVSNTGTVTLGSGGVLTSGLLTNGGVLDLTGGALNLTAGGTSTVAGGLTGAGTLNINGGNLAVSAANSGLSGQTHIADVASVTMTGTGTLGTSAVEVLGTLNLNGANAAMTNVLSGDGTINTNAAVTLSGNNSFSGAHQIGASGALTVGQASNLGASSATVNLGTLTSHLILNGVSESIANVLSGVAGSTVDIIGGADTALTANNSNFLGQYALAGNSKLTVGSTNNLGASSSVTLAGAGDTLSLSGFNGTFGNSVTGSGVLQVTDDAEVTLTSSNGVGNTVKVDIADATLNLDDIALFDHVLTGNGTLNVAKSLASTAFDFGSTVGGAFSGIVNLTNTTFALSADNAAALASATLKLSDDSVTTVGTTDRTLHGLDLNGGTLIFDGSPPQSQANGVVTVTDLALNSGTVSITGAGNWENEHPVTPPNVSLLEQDRGDILLELINAANVTGDANDLDLMVDGTAITADSSGVQSAVQQGGSTVANAIHNYGLTSSNGNGGSGLYVNYTLSALELLADGANALLLATESGLTANRVLNAELFGVGGLVVDAQNGALTLANGNNSYEGTTTVNFGELILGANGAFGQTSLLDIASGASANINGYRQTVGAVTNTGTVTLGSGGVLTSGLLTNGGVLDLTGGALNLTAGGASTVAGGLTGAGTLNINGGNLAVSAANSGLSGQTHIADVASVTMTGTGTLGTSAVEVLGALNLNGANAAMTNVLSGDGTINTNAAVTLSGNNSFSGAHQIGASGALTVGQASNLGASSATVNLGTLTSHLILNGVSESIANVLSGVAGSTVDIIGGADTALTANNSNFLGQYALAGNSKLTVGSTNNLGASSSVTLAGAGDTLSLSGFNGTFGNSVTGNGVLQVTDDAEVTLTSSNGVGSAVTIDIADATLNLDDIALFNHALTGNGLLNVAKNDASTAFDFGSTVGGAFSGIVNLTNTTFALSADNAAALASATLKLSDDSVTTVGTTDRTLHGLDLNGGTLIFDGSPPQSQANGVVTVTDLALNSGTVSITGADNWENEHPVTPPNVSLLEQDRGDILLQLIDADNVTGNANDLELMINGTTITPGQGVQSTVQQGGSTVANATHNYGLTSNGGSGLYVNYTLSALELLADGANALLLATESGLTANRELNAELSGVGGLVVDAQNGALTLANGNNSYEGTTTVTAGELILGANGAFGQTSLLNIASGASANINGYRQTVGAVTNTGTVTLGNGGELTSTDTLINTGIINVTDGILNLENGGTSSISGGLTGNGILNIKGGDFTISIDNNGLAGQTNIADGASVTLGNGGTMLGTGNLGSSVIDVLGDLNLVADNSLANVISGDGTINTTATVTLSGNSSFSGAHQIGTNGELTVGQASNLGASSATVNLGTITSHLILNGVSESIANVLSGVAGSTVDIIGGADTALTANNSGFLGQYALAGNSKLTVGSTNNLGASSSVTLAGAGDTLSLSGFNGTFGNSVTGNGVLQVTDDAEVTLTSSNGVGSAVTIDIADATLNLDDIALFNHALTGNGLLNVAKNDATTAFDFGSTVGGAFTGTVNLNNSTFDLSGNNTTALAQVTLKLSSGNLTSVGNGVQNIGTLAMNGGTLLFDNIVDNSGIITSDGTIAANSIDTTGGGEVRVNLPNNLAPSLDGLSVMELDEGEIIVTLATGTATGTGHELTLTDENGDPISAVTYQGVHNAGSTSAAATGSFNYGMTTGEDYDGLYVNYGLTALELLSTGSEALVLTATLANNGTQSNDLSAQITGSGDLAFASANDGSTASLSNSTNSYTGTTWVSSGNLRLDADSALGQTSLLAMSTATHVDINGTQQVVGELATEGGSTLDLNDGKLTVTGGGQIDGALTGGGELVLSGGLLNVSYDNTGFTGSTDIANGAVAHLSQAQGLGNGTINNNGTLHLDNTIGTLFNALTGSDGEVLLSNNASVQLAGDNSGYSGLFTNQAGSILIANSAEHLGGSSIANSGALILNTGSVWELTNTISGTGTLVKRGSGTVKIEGDTVSAGLTTIEEGLLQLGSSAVTQTLSLEESLQEDALLVSFASNMANLTSNVLITANGSLGGYGQVTGNVENHGNLIMPNALTGGDFGTFTIDGNYTGDEGMITFNTILAGDTSVTDRLVITGGTAGQSYVTVNNIGGVGARTFEGIKIIDVGGDSAGQFTLNGRAVGGAYEYFLYQGGASTPDDGDWYLRTQADDRRPEPASYTANLAAANNMFVTSLSDRMGETLYTDVFTGEQKTTSLWLRNEGSHNRSRDDSGELHTQDNRYVMQLGGDVAQWSRNAQDLWRVGVMAGYANSSSSTVAKVAGYRSTGSVDGYSVGIYGSWLADNADDTGAYVDSWVQYSWFDNNVSGQDLAAEKYDSKGFTASVEGGYAFKVGESVNQSYFIQPKAQVVWMGVKADDHTETNGTVISGDGNGNIQTRLGAKAFINPSDKAKVSGPAFKPFVEANWIHNTKDFGTTLDGVTVKQAGTANIAELKLGVDGQINNQLNLWGNIGQQVGNKGYSETSVVLGVKYNF